MIEMLTCSKWQWGNTLLDLPLPDQCPKLLHKYKMILAEDIKLYHSIVQFLLHYQSNQSYFPKLRTEHSKSRTSVEGMKQLCSLWEQG